MSVYFEGSVLLGPLPECAEVIVSTYKTVIGEDVNAKRVWWVSLEDDGRGRDLLEFLSSSGLNVANQGRHIPTFEVLQMHMPFEHCRCDHDHGSVAG